MMYGTPLGIVSTGSGAVLYLVVGMARVGRILETGSATHTAPLGQQLQVTVDLDATAVEVARGRLAQLRQQCQEVNDPDGTVVGSVAVPRAVRLAAVDPVSILVGLGAGGAEGSSRIH